VLLPLFYSVCCGIVSAGDDFMLNTDAAAATAPFASRGAFNDVDEIGRATCQFKHDTSGYHNACDEAKMRTQFSLIAVVGSPLLLSFDMCFLRSANPSVSSDRARQERPLFVPTVVTAPPETTSSTGYIIES
jgi:hypothetical protein